jgi:hypothetical protein
MPRRSIVLLLILALPGIASSAGLVPLGDEQVVATAADGDHYLYTPDSAGRGSGFVVTWTSAFARYGASQLLDWGAGVSGRRIAADGRPAAGRLTLVPEADKIDIPSSAVATDTAGRYAVVWESAAEHHPNLFVWLRQFSAFGTAVSTTRVDRFGPGSYNLPLPAVALGAAGRPLVVWGQPQLSSLPFSSLLGRFFLPSGQPALPPFAVTARAVLNRAPALGTDARGNAVLAYHHLDANLRSAVYVHAYDRNGRERGGEVRVADLASSPALAVHPNGRYVVTWLEPGGIRARLFDPPYRALGPAIAVTGGSPFAYFPDVAIGHDGRFLVAWMEADPETQKARILARGFNALGAPLGAAFRVDRERARLNEVNAGLGPTVAASESGTFLVSWIWAQADTYLYRLSSRLYGTADGEVAP